MTLQDKIKKQNRTSQPIPTAVNSEMYCIGAAMLLEGAVQSLFSILRHWHFYDDDNRLIWKAITRLVKQDRAITKDLLHTELYKKAFFDKEIDIGYLQICIDSICSGGYQTVTKSALISHKERVFETYTRRRLIDLGATMQFWGLVSSGSTSKILSIFKKRKDRLQKAYDLAMDTDDITEYEYNPSDPVELEDFVLSFEMDGFNYGIAEQGCIVSVSGASGSRKTTLLIGLIASAFRGKVIGFNFERRGKILFFDTEQPKKRFKHTQRRLWNMCNKMNSGELYKAYTLRDKDPEQRVQFIDKVIQKEKGNISAIIIDGILDLVPSMNDEKASTELIQRLMSWTSDTNAVLFPVLHDVKSSGKMGGHLGSLLERKQDAEINVSLAEDNDYSLVKFRKTRAGRKPRSYEFTQDANGWPVLVVPADSDNYIPPTGTEDDVPF